MTTVTHQNQQYNVTRQNDDEWRLTSVETPRDSFTMNEQQMRLAGFEHIVENADD